jgi:hypothetical protein
MLAVAEVTRGDGANSDYRVEDNVTAQVGQHWSRVEVMVATATIEKRTMACDTSAQAGWQ